MVFWRHLDHFGRVHAFGALRRRHGLRFRRGSLAAFFASTFSRPASAAVRRWLSASRCAPVFPRLSQRFSTGLPQGHWPLGDEDVRAQGPGPRPAARRGARYRGSFRLLGHFRRNIFRACLCIWSRTSLKVLPSKRDLHWSSPAVAVSKVLPMPLRAASTISWCGWSSRPRSGVHIVLQSSTSMTVWVSPAEMDVVAVLRVLGRDLDGDWVGVFHGLAPAWVSNSWVNSRALRTRRPLIRSSTVPAADSIRATTPSFWPMR